LCAEGSMTVALPSTPANYFHLLRRHALDGVHRPLVVFTPKSMLRLKAAVSPVADFTSGHRFASVLDDPTVTDPSAVRRVLLCSGKISYELNVVRQQRGISDVAIVRIEQLYPVPKRRLAAALEHYPNASDVRWVQEEPANQGAWPFYGLSLPDLMPERLGTLKRISRRAMAAPSAGSAKVHEVEQRELITTALEH
ncbi:MAG: multifunctional oxoglutarate decarboxylase/oxoglutarate dehydrogenase thiamine pyrophosphate-binding subunit/dihydrolipoyllysine-residue succinyltransferase subunit, partial [Pseudonocardiaceae bacterium]